jgi:hypothetical protein
METNNIKKRSYKEFEKDFFAFNDAKKHLFKKHGDVIEDVSISYTKENKSGLNISVVMNGKLLQDKYDMAN